MTTSVTIEHFGAPGAPRVLLLHPWWGVTAAMRSWAEAIAAAGNEVLIPDLYDGALASTVAEAEAIKDAMDEGRAIERLEALADDLSSTGPWSLVGFSMGAAYGCHLAGRGTAGPTSLVLFYGGWPPPGPCHARAVSLHVVDDDPYFTEDERTATVAACTEAGTTVTVHRYAGVGHWFAEEGSPAYDQCAHHLALSRTLADLGR